MAKVIGFDKTVFKQFTCQHCGAIVEYSPNEVEWNGHTDERTRIMGLVCPNCGYFHRTNP